MIRQINTTQDVITFIEEVAREIADFNPFKGFSNYLIPDTSQCRYTAEEATLRDKLMEQCFDVCKGQSQNFICLAIVVFQEARDYPTVVQLPQPGIG